MAKDYKTKDIVEYFEPNFVNYFTYQAEDLSIMLKLTVNVPQRQNYDTGKKTFTITWTSEKLDVLSGNNPWLSTYYTELSSKDAYNKGNSEAFGIESVNVSYTSWYFPEITIKFVDVRASALFKTAVNHNEDDTLTSQFFKAFFTFPYPTFEITLKGFFGKPVKYPLTVEDMRTSFNSGTGNFEINAKFIVNSYNFLTDIPMKYLLIAPYIDSSNGGGGNKKLTKVYGKDVMTFTDLVNKLVKAKLTIEETTKNSEVTKQIEENNAELEKNQQIVELFDKYTQDKTNYYIDDDIMVIKLDGDSITKFVVEERHFLSPLEYLEIDGNEFNKFIPDYDQLIKLGCEFLIQYEGGDSGHFYGDQKASYPDNKIINTYSFSEDRTLNDFGKKLQKVIKQFGITKENLIYRFVAISQNFNQKKYEEAKQALTDLDKKNTELNETLKTTIKEEFEKELGFKVTLKYIFATVFSHLLYFSDLYTTLLENIKSSKRTMSAKELKKTDIYTNNSDTHVGPFPMIYDNDKGEIIWLEKEPKTKNYAEVDFVVKIFEAAKRAYKKYLEEFGTMYNSEYENQHTLTDVKFIPDLMTDLFHLNKNPYSGAKKDDGDCENIYKTFCQRYILMKCCGDSEALGLADTENMLRFAELEAHNFYLAHAGNQNNKWYESLSSIRAHSVCLQFCNDKGIVYYRIKSDNVEGIPYNYEDSLWETVDKQGKIKSSIVKQNAIKNAYDSLYDKHLYETMWMFTQEEFAQKITKVKTMLSNNGLDNSMLDGYENLNVVGVDGCSHMDKGLRELVFWQKKTTYKAEFDEEKNIFNKKDKNTTVYQEVILDLPMAIYMLRHQGNGSGDDDGECNAAYKSLFALNDGSTITETEDNLIAFVLHALFQNVRDKNIQGAKMWGENKPLKMDGITAFLFGWMCEFDREDQNNILACNKKTSYSVSNIDKLFGTPDAQVTEKYTETIYDFFKFNYSKSIPKRIKNGYTYFYEKYRKSFYDDIIAAYDGIKDLIHNSIEVYAGKGSVGDGRDKYPTYEIVLVGSDSYKECIKFYSDIETAVKKICDSYVIVTPFEHNELYKLDAGINIKSTPDASKPETLITEEEKREVEKLTKDVGNNTSLYCSDHAGFCRGGNFKKYPDDGAYLADFDQTFNMFKQTLIKLYEGDGSDNNVKNDIDIDDIKATEANKLSIYLTLKTLYDRWQFSNEKLKIVAGDNLDFSTFVFYDAYRNDIGDDYEVDPNVLLECIQEVIDAKGGETETSSVYQFLSSICKKNDLTFLSLPVNIFEMKVEEAKTIFEAYPYAKAANRVIDKPTYCVFMMNKPSEHLTSEDDSSEYKDDGADFLVDATVLMNNNWSGENKLPIFGVTYGLQDQKLFKNVRVGMDAPRVTEYALLSTLFISREGDRAVSAVGSFGQNMYNVYANNSYTCTVEMMGDFCILPLMYFQLNNVPMFKGTYIIIDVSHTMQRGQATTTFVGVRMNKNCIRLIKENTDVAKLTSEYGYKGATYSMYKGMGAKFSYDSEEWSRKYGRALNMSTTGTIYGATGGPSACFNGSWTEAVKKMAAWYTENVHTYLRGINNAHSTGKRSDNYPCPLINNEKVGDDCDSFVWACLRLFGTTKSANAPGSTELRNPSTSKHLKEVLDNGWVLKDFNKDDDQPFDIIISKGHVAVRSERVTENREYGWGNRNDGSEQGGKYNGKPVRCSEGEVWSIPLSQWLYTVRLTANTSTQQDCNNTTTSKILEGTCKREDLNGQGADYQPKSENVKKLLEKTDYITRGRHIYTDGQGHSKCTSGPECWYANANHPITFWSTSPQPLPSTTRLGQYGFKIVYHSNLIGADWLTSEELRIGDIGTLYSTEGHGYHGMMWTGSEWRSDYIQSKANCYSDNADRCEDWSFVLWRHPDFQDGMPINECPDKPDKW